MNAPTVAKEADDGFDQFRQDLVKLVPALRGFARGLSRNRDLADDLVQEAMVKAWAARETYIKGSNFRAWMFTILRNEFYNVIRKRKRETSLDPEFAEQTLVSAPAQEGGLHLDDVDRALALIPAHQAEILWLIAGAGLSYEETAEVVGCGVGTVKSRLSRAREGVAAIIDGARNGVIAPRSASTTAASPAPA